MQPTTDRQRAWHLRTYHWCALLVMLAAASASISAEAPPASPEIETLVRALAQHDESAVDAFRHAVESRGSPLIEPAAGHPGKMLVTFVARDVDPAAPPKVFGILDWGALKPFRRVAETDIWTSTLLLPDSTRGAYWLAWPRGRAPNPDALTTQRIPDGTPHELFDDPLARRTAVYFDSTSRGTGRYGWFEGPAAAPQPFLAERPGVPKGTVTTQTVASAKLGNQRMISVYTPPAYDPHRRGGYDLLVVFDREEYLATITAPTLLDNMIADGAIPPVIAVFISAIGDPARNVELPGNADFQAFVHDELLVSLRRKYAITDSADRSVVAGASYGGLCATLMALRYPDRFGNVLSQSGAFWWGPDYVLDEEDESDPPDRSEASRLFARAPRLPLRFYMDVGLLEGDLMVLPNRHLRDVLVAKGYSVAYEEVQAGHDWISWRGTFPNGLIALLGSRSQRAAQR